MPVPSQTALGGNSSTTTIVVDISIPSLVHILSNLNRNLAKSGQRPLSIYVVNHQRDPNGNRVSRIPESIAVRSVIKLLKMYMHRVTALVVHAELKSSLNEVVSILDTAGQGAVERALMYYNIDDLA